MTSFVARSLTFFVSVGRKYLVYLVILGSKRALAEQERFEIERMAQVVCLVADMDLTAVQTALKVVVVSMEAQEVFQVETAAIAEIAGADVVLFEMVEKGWLWTRDYLVGIGCRNIVAGCEQT